MKLMLHKFPGPTWLLILFAVLMLVYFLMLLLLLLMGLSVKGAPSSQGTQPVMDYREIREQILTNSPCRGINAGNLTSWQPVFIVVITAESSSTQIHSFAFLRCCLDNKFVLQEEDSFVDERSIVSSWRSRKKLQPLLTALLRRANDFVPLRFQSSCPLLFRAAANFRKLVSARDSRRLLARVRSSLRLSSFRVRSNQVTIMAETDQAADLWLSASFLTGRLYDPVLPPFVVAHLDGENLWVSIPTRKKLTVVQHENMTNASLLGQTTHPGTKKTMEVARNPRDLRGSLGSFDSSFFKKSFYKDKVNKDNKEDQQNDETLKSWTRRNGVQASFQDIMKFYPGKIWPPVERQRKKTFLSLGAVQNQVATERKVKFPSLQKYGSREIQVILVDSGNDLNITSRNYTKFPTLDSGGSNLRPISLFGSKYKRNASLIKGSFKSESSKFDIQKNLQLSRHRNSRLSPQIKLEWKKTLFEETIKRKTYPHEEKYIEKNLSSNKRFSEKKRLSRESFGKKENFVDWKLDQTLRYHNLNTQTKLDPNFWMMKRSFPAPQFPKIEFISFVNTLCQLENDGSLESQNKESNPYWLGNLDLPFQNLNPERQNVLSWYCKRRMSLLPDKADSFLTQREVFLRKHIRKVLAAVFARHELFENSILIGQIKRENMSAKFGVEKKSSHLKSKKEWSFVNNHDNARKELKSEQDLYKNKRLKKGRRQKNIIIKGAGHNKKHTMLKTKKHPHNSYLDEFSSRPRQRAGMNIFHEILNKLAIEQRENNLKIHPQEHPPRAEKNNQHFGQRHLFQPPVVQFGKTFETSAQNKKKRSFERAQRPPQTSQKMRRGKYRNSEISLYPGHRFSSGIKNHSNEWTKLSSSVTKNKSIRHYRLYSSYESRTGREAITMLSSLGDDETPKEIRGTAEIWKYFPDSLDEARRTKLDMEAGITTVAPLDSENEYQSRVAKSRQKEARRGSIFNKMREGIEWSKKRMATGKKYSDKQDTIEYENRKGERIRRGARNKVTFRCSSTRKIRLYAASFPLGIYPARVSVLLEGKRLMNSSTNSSSTPKTALSEAHSATTLPQPAQTTPPRRRGDIPAEEEYDLNVVSDSRILAPRLSIVQTVEPHGPGPPFGGTQRSPDYNSPNYSQDRTSKEADLRLKKTWVQRTPWSKLDNEPLAGNETMGSSSQEIMKGNVFLVNNTMRTMWTLDTLNKVKNIVDSILREFGTDRLEENRYKDDRNTKETTSKEQNKSQRVVTSSKDSEKPKEIMAKSTSFSPTTEVVSPEPIIQSSCLPVGSQGRINIDEKSYVVMGKSMRGNRTHLCWQEVSNIIRKHVTLPPIGNKEVLATAAFYFIASSANLINGSKVSGGYVETWQFQAAADEVCAQVTGQSPDPLACLDYQFVAALLLVGLGIPPNRPIMVSDYLGGFQINSALGTALDYLQGH